MKYINPTRIDAIAVALGGVGATQALPALENAIKIPIVPIVLAAALSITIFNIVKYFLKELPLKSSVTRKWLDKKSHFEGFYLETKNSDGGQTYSIFNLTYNPKEKKYAISGIGVENGGLAFQWKSTSMFIDPEQRKVTYSTEGRATNSANPQNFEGITFLNFDFQTKNPQFGTGHFIDTLPAFGDFEFKRITKEDCLNLISKKEMNNTSDYIEFLNKYIANSPKQIFTT